MNESRFNWKGYGTVVKQLRKKNGHKTQGAFAKAVTEGTGAYVSESQINRIEKGSMPPTAESFLAVNMFLFGDPMPPQMRADYRIKTKEALA